MLADEELILAHNHDLKWSQKQKHPAIIEGMTRQLMTLDAS